jgi:hypothetical protein
MGTIAKIAAVTGIFFAVFLGSQTVFRPKSPKEIQANLERDVAKIKETLPQQVHPLVTWFDVEAGRQTIIYKYKLHAPRALIMNKRREMEKELKSSLTIGVAKFMIPSGVKMQCELYDEHGSFMFSIDLD